MYLAGKSLYLSSPIQFAEDDSWREGLVNTLTDRYKLNVFDPTKDEKQYWVGELNQAKKDKDYSKIRKIAKRFVKKDLQIVQRSDILLAYLPYRVPTIGTIHEIICANDLKNPVLLVTNTGCKTDIAFWLYGFIPHEHMFDDFNSLYSYLDQVDAGQHKDNDRWSMVYNMV